MPRVLVTRALPAPALERLHDAGVEIDHHDEHTPMPHDRLVARGATCDGVLSLLTDRIGPDVIAAWPRVRVIGNIAVGVDNIDVAAATARGIAVTNTPGVLTEATAELTWALILAVTRRVVEADGFLRSGRWRGWDLTLLLGTELTGKTLGVVGAGRIGRAVAARAAAFGMRVAYATRGVAKGFPGERMELDALMARADVLTLHVPLTAETRHLVDARRLALMKPTAYLINTARGAVVDEQALIEALAAGRLAGAGLDVFEREPEVPEPLLRMPNVVLLPHVGSATRQTRTRMALMAVEDVLAVLEGRRAANVVNPESIRD